MRNILLILVCFFTTNSFCQTNDSIPEETFVFDKKLTLQFKGEDYSQHYYVNSKTLDFTVFSQDNEFMFFYKDANKSYVLNDGGYMSLPDFIFNEEGQLKLKVVTTKNVKDIAGFSAKERVLSIDYSAYPEGMFTEEEKKEPENFSIWIADNLPYKNFMYNGVLKQNNISGFCVETIAYKVTLIEDSKKTLTLPKRFTDAVFYRTKPEIKTAFKALQVPKVSSEKVSQYLKRMHAYYIIFFLHHNTENASRESEFTMSVTQQSLNDDMPKDAIWNLPKDQKEEVFTFFYTIDNLKENVWYAHILNRFKSI